MRRRIFLKVAGVVFLSPLAISKASESGIQTQVDIQRQLRFNLSVHNPFNYGLTDQSLWLYGPVARTASQALIKLDASMKFDVKNDALNQTIMHFTFAELAPLSTRQITIVSDLIIHTESVREPLVHPESWINPEKYIESSDEQIKVLASQLTRHTEEATCAAIYDWVRQNLTYIGYIADDLGAAYAISERKGDCTEYACLVAALARANNIPARVMGGYVVNNNTIVRSQEYHNWVEVYVGNTWKLIDAQKQNLWASSSQYVVWHILQERNINSIGLANRYRAEGDIVVMQ